MKYRLATGALTVALGVAAISMAAFASGAPWYKWINPKDKTILCSQNAPGDGWVQYQGPFMESRCKKSGNPQ